MAKNDESKNNKKGAAEAKKDSNNQQPEGQKRSQKPDAKALETLSKRDRQRIEKLMAEVEYEDAHGNSDAALKICERIASFKAAAKAKAERKAERKSTGGEEEIKVIHSGGHRKTKV